MIRPDDLLVLEFGFFNIERQDGTLRRRDPGKAYLVVTHQTQSLADGAYLTVGDQPDHAKDQAEYTKDPQMQGHQHDPPQLPPPPVNEAVELPVPIRAAGPSRLAYEMPADETSLPFTLDGLLDACRRWPLHLSSAARPESAEPDEEDRWSWWRSVLAVLVAVTNALFGGVLTWFRGQRAVIGIQREPVGRSVAEGAIGLAIFLGPRPPEADQTTIELPWRLLGSPLPGAGFAHAATPVVRAGRTELWHTRLGERREGADGSVSVEENGTQKLRYLWSPDYVWPPDYDGPQVQGPRFSLDWLDRKMIVQLTAGYDEVTRTDSTFIPRPVVARRLMLSALGGLLDVDRRWVNKPYTVDLLAWTHRASQGRDSYVRVEYAGFLLPVGHAATLVKLSERTFEWLDGGRIAVLRQRFFIVVRERLRFYPNGPPQPFDGKKMPFDAVECLVETTPDLAAPGSGGDDRLDVGFYASKDEYRRAFWPSRGKKTDVPSDLYCFPLVGIDAAGRRVPFEAPLMFVSEVMNRSGRIEQIRDHYDATTPTALARRRMEMKGATIRFASPGPTGGDVDFPTNLLLFRSVDPVGGLKAVQQPTLQQQPIFEDFEIEPPSVKRLTGVSLPLVVEFDAQYAAGGFGGSGPGEIFLRVKKPATLAFGSGGAGTDSVGALASPSMVPGGLSRRFGVVGGNAAAVAGFAAGTFNPTEYFPDAKLLGWFKLSDLLENGVPIEPAAPVLTTTEFPDRFETRFRLAQDVKKEVEGLVTGAGGITRLELVATTVQHKDGSPPQAEVEGTLTNFKINLVGVIVLHFDRLHFLNKGGHKPEVDVDLNPANAVTFGGPLEFINTLKDYIPANGFSDPPDLQVTSKGLTVGYSLGLPAIQCGILSLSNVTLGAAFTLPFTGEAPTARFNFAERHNTFNLTVALFGGGGFFAAVVSAEGVKEIEVALEFGAQIAINLGVASGSVYVKGGFYFCYALSPKRVAFQGYVELGGRLSVLGLISVSLLFHLSLTYESLALPDKADGSPHSSSRLFGQASLVVEIEILFFSTSVSVTVEKTFAGSEADPAFIDFIPAQGVWDEYCGKFA